MRGLVMTPRSVYSGIACLHCGRNIANGRAFFGSTLFIDPKHPAYVRTSSAEYRYDREITIRMTYHRSCVERVLGKSPLDPDVAVSRLEEYRLQLLERYGLADDEMSPPIDTPMPGIPTMDLTESAVMS